MHVYCEQCNIISAKFRLSLRLVLSILAYVYVSVLFHILKQLIFMLKHNVFYTEQIEAKCYKFYFFSLSRKIDGNFCFKQQLMDKFKMNKKIVFIHFKLTYRMLSFMPFISHAFKCTYFSLFIFLLFHFLLCLSLVCLKK